MTNYPKGLRIIRKERAKEIIRLHEEGKGWTWIGDILSMDKSNVRRTYLKVKNERSEIHYTKTGSG